MGSTLNKKPKLIERLLDIFPIYMVVLNTDYNSSVLYHSRIKWLAKRKLKKYEEYFKGEQFDVELIKL